jgi:hypothetical protein
VAPFDAKIIRVHLDDPEYCDYDHIDRRERCDSTRPLLRISRSSDRVSGASIPEAGRPWAEDSSGR